MAKNEGTKAWLVGEEYEFSVAIESFAEDEIRITRGDSRYFLSHSSLDALEGQSLVEASEKLIEFVNAVCRKADTGYRSLSLSGSFATQDGGALVALQTIRVRGTGTLTVAVSSSEPLRPTTPADALRKAAGASSDVASLVRTMGRGNDSLGWVELWKAYEIVRKYAADLLNLPEKQKRKIKPLVQIGWATQSEADDFETSANRPEISGDGARHAVLPGKASGKAMDLRAGRALINRLAENMVDDVLT